MGGEDKLDIGVQFANHADKLLLPFDVQGGFRLVHEKHTAVIVTHQYGQQDDEHLLLTRRQFVGQQALAVLIENDVVAFAVYLLMGIAEKFVHHILELPLGNGKGGSQATLLFITTEQLYHLIANVHLVVQITALEQIELPVQFRLHVGIGHACRKVAHDEGAVIATDYIIRDKGGCGVVEVDVYPVLLVTLHFTRCLFQIVDRTVQDSGLPHSVDAGKYIDVRTQVPGNIVPMPQSVYFDTLDVIGLYFHGFLL